MNQFKVIHTYNSLVDVNKAAPLLCPDDHVAMYVIADLTNKEPVPALKCSVCDAHIVPGLDLWKQIENVVLEHYDRRLFD